MKFQGLVLSGAAAMLGCTAQMQIDTRYHAVSQVQGADGQWHPYHAPE